MHTLPTNNTHEIGLDLPMTAIGRNEGLPSNQIHCLTEDAQGRFWFASPSGLARYDGARVTAYGPKHGLSTQGLRSLAVGHDGRLWIGSDVGLDVLEPDGTIRPALGGLEWSSGFVESILAEASGRVWLGTAQGLKWLDGEGRLQPETDLRLSQALVNCMAQEPSGRLSGRLWAGGQFGLLYHEQNRWHAPKHEGWLEVGTVRALLLAPDGTVLVGGDRGLVQLDPDGVLVRRLEQPQTVNAIHLQPQELWLGIGGELRRYRPVQGVWRLEATVLADTQVNDLAADGFGNLWVATDNRAVLRISALRNALLRPDLAQGNGVFSIQPTVQGGFLIGGDNASWRLELGETVVASRLEALDGHKVWDLVEDPHNGLWAATQEGLRLVRGDQACAVAAHDPVLGSPNRVLLRRGEELWVGTVRGLSVVSQGAVPQGKDGGFSFREITAATGEPLGYVYTMIEDRAGRLWVGSLGNGLWCETEQGLVQVVGEGLKARANVYAIALREDGHLAVLQDNRIVEVHPDDPSRSRLVAETADPIAGWTARFVGDQLWAGSASGLHQYDARTGQERRQVTAWLGLSGWEFTTSRSLALDARGCLICGLNSGLMVVNLAELERFRALPRLNLGQVRWFQTEYRQKGNFFKVRQGKWNVEFDFFSPWFVDEGQLLYRHRLLGFDRDWSEPNPLPQIHFNSLPAGEFTVEAQAYSPLVGWGPVAQLATIRVEPAPLSDALAGLIGLASSRWRNRRLLEKNLALEQRVRERTEQLGQANLELQRLNAQLEAQARTDALSGLANRRLFEETARKELRRAERDGTPISLVMLDIDHFKEYNDTFGHPQGDECIRRAAQVFASSIRDGVDLVARYGGEEFIAILPNTGLADARVIVERLRAGVEGLRLPHPRSAHAVVTISLGVVTRLPPCGAPLEELLSVADQALYQAKRAGRNRATYRERLGEG